MRLSRQQASRLPQLVRDMTSLLRSHNRTPIACALVCLLALADASWAGASGGEAALPTPQGLRAAPAAFVLDGSESTQRVVVTGVRAHDEDLHDEDLTTDYSRAAHYESSNPRVATVNSDGLVIPRGDGVADIRAT